MSARTILVTGATGKQGSAVINALLKVDPNSQIIALTRNAQSAAAQKLVAKSKNIKLVTGNLDKVEDVFKSAKDTAKAPIWGVFSVQTPMGDGQTPESEERQGKALVDAALKNGTKNFVYSSVDRGGDIASDSSPTPIPHFQSKHRIEQYLFEKAKGTDMQYTVLRPVAFYENFIPGFIGKVFVTSINTRLHKNQRLQLIATSDIGFFAAEAFTKPEYANTKLSLAGDEVNFAEFKEVFEKQTGQTLPTTFGFLAGAINKMVKELGVMFTWFKDVGYGADIPKLRALHPELKDLKAWLATESAWKKE